MYDVVVKWVLDDEMCLALVPRPPFRRPMKGSQLRQNQKMFDGLRLGFTLPVDSEARHSLAFVPVEVLGSPVPRSGVVPSAGRSL